jgi:hypothetical protein
MTKQEIFNKVWNHFVVNKNPFSFNAQTKLCCYRTDDGNMCAVGLLIPDEEYHKGLEGLSVHSLLKDKVPYLTEFYLSDSSMYNFLDMLQEAHDLPVTRGLYAGALADSDAPDSVRDNVEEHLKLLAQDYNLTIPV